MDAQADLSLRWAHMSFCWFCHAAAQVPSMVGFSVLRKLYTFWDFQERPRHFINNVFFIVVCNS